MRHGRQSAAADEGTRGDRGDDNWRARVEPHLPSDDRTRGLTASVKADAGVFTSGDVPYGDHVVRLVDVPARCRVDGGPERKISLSEKQQSTAVRFSVQCS